MSYSDFFDAYTSYKSFKADPAAIDLYLFLSRPSSVGKMVEAISDNASALSGVVKGVETLFSTRLDYSKPTPKQMTGAMIAHILKDYGFRPEGDGRAKGDIFVRAAKYRRTDDCSRIVSSQYVIINKVTGATIEQETIIL